MIDCVITYVRSAAYYNKQYNHIVVVSAHLLILVYRIKCFNWVKQSKLFIVFVLTFMAYQMATVHHTGDRCAVNHRGVNFEHLAH